VYGDPEAIRRLARQAGGWADEMRADATRSAQAAETRWQSVRAGRYREQLTEAVEHARGAARELDELREALDAHADAVERRLAQIAAAERWLRRQVADAWDIARRGLEMVEGLAEDVGNFIGLGDDDDADKARSDAEAATARAKQLSGQVDGVAAGDQAWIDMARANGWNG
jgi:hypothetical protein